jgi:hypothetical protein
METTFLAGIWGPVILAVGIGIFVSRDYYERIYRDLQKEKFATLAFGMTAITVGILQSHYHLKMGSLSEIIITLLGLMLAIKGFVMVILPKAVDQGGDWTADNNLIQASGVVMVLLGIYLTAIAYFI